MIRTLHPVGRLFAIIAILEALTWTGLLTGMFLKYVTETTELGVTIFGWFHGIAFIAYAGIAIVAAIVLRWSWWVALIALLAALPPLATIPIERWLSRRGNLARPQQQAT